jgi:hypothetical protein
MPIVFEEMTGEVEPRRGNPSAEGGTAASSGPSADELHELLSQQLRLLAERCERSRAD